MTKEEEMRKLLWKVYVELNHYLLNFNKLDYYRMEELMFKVKAFINKDAEQNPDRVNDHYMNR
jgi:hypothetical protein